MPVRNAVAAKDWIGLMAVKVLIHRDNRGDSKDDSLVDRCGARVDLCLFDRWCS